MPAEAAKEWPYRDDGTPALQLFRVPDVDPEDHPLGIDNERPVPAVAAECRGVHVLNVIRAIARRGRDRSTPVCPLRQGDADHDRGTQFPGSEMRSGRSPPGMTLAGCKGSDRSDCLRGAARPELRGDRLRPPSSATVPLPKSSRRATGHSLWRQPVSRPSPKTP